MHIHLAAEGFEIELFVGIHSHPELQYIVRPWALTYGRLRSEKTRAGCMDWVGARSLQLEMQRSIIAGPQFSQERSSPMKRSLLLLILSLPLSTLAQDQKQNQKPATLKSILLEELISTHNKKDWFV